MIIRRTVLGTALLLGLAGAALGPAFIVVAMFRLDGALIFGAFGVVLALMVFVLAISYVSRRARNATEPAGTSFEHVLLRSGGICLHSCLAATFFGLFWLMCVFIVLEIEEGHITTFPLVPFAIIATVSLFGFGFHAWMLTDIINPDRGDA